MARKPVVFLPDLLATAPLLPDPSKWGSHCDVVVPDYSDMDRSISLTFWKERIAIRHDDNVFYIADVWMYNYIVIKPGSIIKRRRLDPTTGQWYDEGIVTALPSSFSGQDTALSLRQQGFDSPWRGALPSPDPRIRKKECEG